VLARTMPLSTGTRLGSYEVAGRIGAGGMGEVYRARDTTLGRDVAIKVLPASLADNPQRLARFQHEARVLAALNHTNIAHIYGIEQGALVMELVEGRTLEGPVPAATAIAYARQIADALEAAHEKGIVHRDLKPGNVMVTANGVIKVLDFGLAITPEATQDPDNSPTVAVPLTEAGMVMGTAAYMSPEQASGKPVDKRADIWAFGVLLFELLTGRKLFTGETTSHVLAAVLTKEPDLTAVPASLRPVIEGCLRKDPRARWHDITDVRMLLELRREDPVQSATPAFAWIPWAVAAAAIIAAIVAVFLRTPPAAADRPFAQVDVEVGAQVAQPALSPDGSRIVFVSGGKLAMRRLDQTEIVALPGTEGASFPFFSPNGEWVAFFAAGKLRKIAVAGGPVQTIGDVTSPRGGSWGADDVIIASREVLDGLWQFPANAGEPRRLTSPAGDPEGMTAHRWPQILPDGKGVLFSATAGLRGSLRVLLPDGKIKSLLSNAPYGRYSTTGHVIYYQSGSLFAARFDLDRLELSGPAIPLVQGVAFTPNVANADFDLSPAGTLVYVKGPASTGRVVSWVDASGTVTPLLAKPREYAYVAVSPDGKRVAAIFLDDRRSEMWVYDPARDLSTKLNSGGIWPVWTPQGDYILTGIGPSMRWSRSDGGAGGEAGPKAETIVAPGSFSKAGDWLTYSDDRRSWTVSFERTQEGPKLGKPEALLDGLNPDLSPDGRFVAYTSRESGRAEVYVRPLVTTRNGIQVAAPGRQQISSEGGSFPQWSSSRQELFYQGSNRRIWVASYTLAGDQLMPQKARHWSEVQIADLGNTPSFSLAPDGKRVAAILDSDQASQPETRIHMLFNLPDELRRREASGTPK
jgi:serine/threonine-protein kinase